ncbi:MAG: tetratricopeptide repeat protein, partial [Candidatus Hydrogenedentes bacterium]|nr:tetratricopeptide repeat protein [Candidatus Hydrogenedentota bacterium]
QGQGRLGEAQEAFRKMFAVAKEDDTRRQAATMLAGIYQQQGQLEDLAREFQGRIRNTPKRLAAYQDLSAIFAQAGDNTRAIAVLEDGLNTVDERAPALQALVRASFDAQDYPRVVSYYEQLLAASGKPTPQELEKLGQVYSEMGEIEKARATWDRMTAENPKDPKAFITLANALERAGMNEESLAARATALELAPGDYKARMEYARNLAEAGQSDAAIEQVHKLLEIGDPKAKTEEEKSKEKKVKTLGRGRQASYSYYYSSCGGYQRMYRSRGAGGFEDVRREAISAMAGWSQNSTGTDALVDEFKKKIEANPANVQAMKDLLSIYRTVNQPEDAIAAAEQIIARAPDDADAVEQAAEMYVQKRDVDKAVEKLARLAELQPLKRKDILVQQLNLYANATDDTKLSDTVTTLTNEFGDDYMVVSQIVNTLINRGKFDTIKAMRDRIEQFDPRYRASLRGQLAMAYQRSNEMDEARALYGEVLFSDDEYQRGAVYRRRGRGNVYAPLSLEERQNRGYPGQPSAQQLSNLGVIASMDYNVSSAAHVLLTRPENADTAAATEAKLVEAARGYATAESQAQRDRAWDLGKILVAHTAGKDEHDAARQYLAEFKALGVDDTDWFNLSIYLDEKEDQYDAIIALYDEWQKKEPARAKEITLARVKTYLAAENYTAAAKSIQDIMGQGFPPGE